MSNPDVPEAVECHDTPSGPESYATRREARAAEAARSRHASATNVPAADSTTDALPPHAPAARPHAVSTPALPHGPAVRPRSRIAPRPLPDDTLPRRSASPSATRSSMSRRALGFATFSAVGGLFATAAIPAYAARSSVADVGVASAPGDAQKLTVSASAASEAVVRDAFAAPTTEQLHAATRQASVLAAASNGNYTIVTTLPVGDDYPWPNELPDIEGGGLSPLLYYYRECVDFVAWRLNRDAGTSVAPWKYTWSVITPSGGSAYEWPDNWASKGWATSSTPIIGCVAWFSYNHVAYVQSINDDGTVLIEEYNYGGKHSYGTRTLAVSAIPLFLYPPGT